jgi:transcriptional regulator with XRE-family HTH domain
MSTMKFKIKRLERLRIDKKLTIAEMATKIGVSRQIYYIYLSEYGKPTLETITKIAIRSRIPEEELVEFAKLI